MQFIAVCHRHPALVGIRFVRDIGARLGGMRLRSVAGIHDAVQRAFDDAGARIKQMLIAVSERGAYCSRLAARTLACTLPPRSLR